MRGCVPVIAMFVALCAIAGTGHASSYGISSPTTLQPMRITAGEPFTVKIALPIALTPPPGVQKASVWREWRVVLRRTVHAGLGTKSNGLRYDMRFLKIRPCDRNVDYLVTAESQRWLPSGRYDIEVVGPGFSYVAKQAIVAGDTSMREEDVSSVRMNSATWKLSTGKQGQMPKWFEVVVGKEVPGVKVVLNGAPVPLDDIFWASFRFESRMKGSTMDYIGGSDGRRLMRVRIPDGLTEATVVLSKIESSAVKESGKSVRIAFDRESVRPMEWVSVSAVTSFSPVKVIWLFADGDNAVGAKTEYRWMVTTEAVARVTAFDAYGTVHQARVNKPLIMPLSRQSLSCGTAPLQAAGATFFGFVFNACFETILLLME